MQQFDTIIIGAGSAGCVLAKRLSEDLDHRVLLIEAGGSDRWHWLHIPAGYLYAMNNPRCDWCYHLTPQAGLNGRTLPYPRGKVLGGCSAINGMIYARGHKNDYARWGLPDWQWDNILPLFKRSEKHFNGETLHHGDKGELPVTQQRLRWQVLEAWQDACNSFGIPTVDDFNAGDNFGVGLFQVNQRHGLRRSAYRAFVNPILTRKNLAVWRHRHVDKLIFNDSRQRIDAIELVNKRKKETLHARGQVILAAGAIGSPSILQRSGIACASKLAKLDIPCQLELKGVGENLHDHLQIRVAFRVENCSTLNEKMHSYRSKLKMGWDYLKDRSGPLSMAPSQLGAFFHSDGSQSQPNLEFHVQPLSTDALGGELHKTSGITASVCHLQPTSRGSTWISSRKPEAMPAIDPNYLSTDHDQQIAIDAVLRTREIASQQAVQKFNPVEIKPGPDTTTRKDILKSIGNVASSIFHPVGTCKMGKANDSMAVTDESLKVFGINNLYVADASIMPTITSGNTHAPVTMIAEKLAASLN